MALGLILFTACSAERDEVDVGSVAYTVCVVCAAQPDPAQRFLGAVWTPNNHFINFVTSLPKQLSSVFTVTSSFHQSCVMLSIWRISDLTARHGARRNGTDEIHGNTGTWSTHRTFLQRRYLPGKGTYRPIHLSFIFVFAWSMNCLSSALRHHHHLNRWGQ